MDEQASRGGVRPPLTLESSRPAPGVLVVRVGGELDMWTTPALEQYLREETADRPAELVVDLSGVTFIGSHGCAVLVRAADDGDGIHGRLSLVGVSHRPVARTLELTGLATAFPIYADVTALLAHVGSSASGHRSDCPAERPTSVTPER